MKVPFFDYSKLFQLNHDSYLKIFLEVANRGAFIMQSDVHEFENELAKYLSAKRVVGVGNATDGLEIAWMAVGLNDGDEVICSAHTMLATASAIKMAGGTPVPVDIGDDGLISPTAITDAITDRTVGISPTQLNGRSCDMEKIATIAEEHDLVIVEDAAQSLGAKFNGKNVGTFGRFAAISFFPAKVLGSFGDAGAVVVNDDQLYESIYQLHDHGRTSSGEVRSWGRNSRLDNLQAAFLSFGLSRHEDVIERRRQIAQQYQCRLETIDQIKLPPAPNSDSRYFDVYQNYEIRARSRDKLRLFLSDSGVGTLIQWGGKAIHQWAGLGLERYSLPEADAFFEECIMLPMNNFITDDEVDYVCDVIHSFYKKH